MCWRYVLGDVKTDQPPFNSQDTVVQQDLTIRDGQRAPCRDDSPGSGSSPV